MFERARIIASLLNPPHLMSIMEAPWFVRASNEECSQHDRGIVQTRSLVTVLKLWGDATLAGSSSFCNNDLCTRSLLYSVNHQLSVEGSFRVVNMQVSLL